MTTDGKFDLILSKLDCMATDIQDMKADSQLLKKKAADIELHLENTTNWNIKLLAESHNDLIDKLNQSIPVANKNLIYEVKVSYLIGEVENLKREVEKPKSRIA